MPRARTIRVRRAPRRGKRRKRRATIYRPPLGPQTGGNFLFKLLGTMAKTLDALT